MNSEYNLDFDSVLEDYWQFHVNDEGVGIEQVITGKHIRVFYDCMLTLLFWKDDAEALHASKVAAVHRVKPAFVGMPHSLRITFTEQPGAVFVDVGGTPIKDERIQRLNLYARTDAGTIVVALVPTFSKDSRVLSVLVTQQAEVCQMIQALTVGWLDEIIVQH